MTVSEKEQFKYTENGLRVLAPAKINLSLLIAGKRPDGFHELRTIMAKVDWFDELLIEKSSDPTINLTCTGPYEVPPGKDNIVFRACDLLLTDCGIKTGVKITLTKNIPAGSGLGSGSSDAAATLLGLNKLLNLNLPPEKLSALASSLGSDVAFFLGLPLAFCTGRGEKIKELEKIFDFTALLILPNVSVSTARVYANYSHDPDLFQTLNSQIQPLLDKNRLDLIVTMCANMLQNTCFSLYKQLAELKGTIESLAVRPLCLSGSGSTLFYLSPGNCEKANYYKKLIEDEINCRCVIVSNNKW